MNKAEDGLKSLSRFLCALLPSPENLELPALLPCEVG